MHTHGDWVWWQADEEDRSEKKFDKGMVPSYSIAASLYLFIYLL